MNTADHDQANAQIAQALASQQAKLAARSNGRGTSAGDATANGQTPIHTPHDLLRLHIEPRLGQWAYVKQHPLAGAADGQHHLPKARAAIELLRGLLAKLEGKAGDRAASTREELQLWLATIQKAVDHFHSLGAKLDGPQAQELERKIVEVRAAQIAAGIAKEAAVSRDELREASIDADAAEASARACDRAIAEAVAGLVLPALPDANVVRDAENATRDLERSPRKGYLAADVKKAIEEGERGAPGFHKSGSRSGGQAMYWICFESQPTHPLCEWRYRGHTAT